MINQSLGALKIVFIRNCRPLLFWSSSIWLVSWTMRCHRREITKAWFIGSRNEIILIDREEKESYILQCLESWDLSGEKTNSERSQVPTGIMVIIKRTAHPVVRVSVKRVKFLSTATSWRSNNSRTCCILFIIIWDVHDVVGLLGCTGMFCLHITSVH